jgi:hypothetical protein
MKVNAISVQYARKINMGNYASATLGITMWADLDEGEDAAEASIDLQTQARDLVANEYHRMVSKAKHQVEHA